MVVSATDRSHRPRTSLFPSPPEIMTTGKIHRHVGHAINTARCIWRKPCGFYRASCARYIVEKMSGEINHPDDARASEKIQGSTSVSVKFTTNIFLPPPTKTEPNYVSRLRRRTPSCETKETRRNISLCCHTSACPQY